MPPIVLEPTSAQEAAFMLFDAGLQGRRLVPRGGGTKAAGAALNHATDAWLSTLRLAGAIEHDPGDMVATIPARMPLNEANWQLAQAGQWLPLDPPDADRATIGGIVATNDSGPRRHRYGAPRDLILGVQLAMTDGRVAHAGGRVVKNVAGYDLSRLVCGSEGRLGVVTAATFKLAPIAPASLTLIIEARDLATLCGIGASLAAAPTASPSAIEIATHPERMLVRFDSTPSATERMAAATAALAGGVAAVRMLTEAEAAQCWREHEPPATHDRGEALVKLTLLPSTAAAALTALQQRAHALRLSWSLRGRLALGVFDVRLQGETPDLRAMIETMTAVARSGEGHAVVRRGALELQRLSLRRDQERVRQLEQAVMQQFDPRGVLSSEPLLPEGPRI